MIGLTGASGPFSQRVLHHLIDALGVAPSMIVAASRNPSKLAAWAARGVVTHALDFDQPSTIATAVAGVDRVLQIGTDALDRPGRRLAQHRAAVDAAAAAGVRHVVYTSMPKPEGSPITFAPDPAGTEAALAASALPGWTVLRNHWYFENLFGSLPHALATGQWYGAAADGAAADLSRDDLARAAATVLAGTESGRHTCTLSGAEALTRIQIAQRLNAATGRPLPVVPVPVEALVQGMVGAGLPEPLARAYASFDTNTAAGRVAEVTDDFRRITGVAPKSFDAWLDANAGAFTAA